MRVGTLLLRRWTLCFSKYSLNIQQTTRHHVTKDNYFHIYRRKNLVSFKIFSRPGKFLLGLASTVNIVFPILLHTFKCVFFFRREKGSDYYWSLPLYWGVTGPLLHTHTHCRKPVSKCSRSDIYILAGSNEEAQGSVCTDQERKSSSAAR
jgi:hypothetical protein